MAKRTMQELLAESEQRVLDVEQRANVRRLSAARLAAVSLGLVVLLAEGAAATTLAAAAAYLALGVTVFALFHLSPRSAPLLPWVLPLLDVPLVAFTQDLRLTEGAPLRGVIADSACLNLGFVVLASLSMSPRVVIATAATGFIAFASTALGSGVSVRELDLSLFAFAVTAVVMASSTARLLPLAIKLRRQAWAGRYKIGRRVGAGGMAEVFEAVERRDEGLERRVALKRILPAFASREDMQRMFLRELELSALMSHPHIVQVLDSGADEEGPFLVMEFIDGATLTRLMKNARQRGEPVSREMCFELAEQLLSAVEHIHSRHHADGTPMRLMHRDLNPPNVIVTRTGELKVTDFGIARLEKDVGLTKSGEVRGKLIWAAPEQLAGERLSPSVDLFSVGLILAEVALGRHPTDDIAPTREMVHRVLPGLSAQRPELGETWWSLVSSLLQPEVAQRCPGASVALRSLRQHAWDRAQARADLARLVADDAEQVTSPA